MADRQTRNVSLTPHQDEFVDSMVREGRYRTASEVLREGLRLLEEAEHRRLLEKWLYDDLTEHELAQLPEGLKNRVQTHFQAVVEKAMQEVENGRVIDGPEAMMRLQVRLKQRLG